MYRFYRVVDEYRTSFRRNLPSSVTIKYIVKLRYDTQKAFPRRSLPQEISSDGDAEPGSAATAAAAASSRRTRTQDLLRDERARIRIDEMKSSSDLEVMIHQLWPCTEPDCSNYENYCWVHPRTRLHYKIETIDVETWVLKCQISNSHVSPSQPPASVITIWEKKRGVCKRKTESTIRREQQQPPPGERGLNQALYVLRQLAEIQVSQA
ncbi:hypothetical protein K469DRAFT_709878, partial [Zopfia rhizophila CBS 207.26]